MSSPSQTDSPAGEPIARLLGALAEIRWSRPENFLKRAAQRIRQATGAWRVTVLERVGNEDFELVALAGEELGDGDDIEAGPVSSTVAHSGEPFVCDDINNHPSHTGPHTGDYRNSSCAVVPLESGGDLLGLLCVSSMPSLEPWFERNRVLEAWQPVLGQITGHLRNLGSGGGIWTDPELDDLLEAATGTETVVDFFGEFAGALASATGVDGLMLVTRESSVNRLMLATPGSVNRKTAERMFRELKQRWEQSGGVLDYRDPEEALFTEGSAIGEDAATGPDEVELAEIGDGDEPIGALAYSGISGQNGLDPFLDFLELGIKRVLFDRGESGFEPVGSVVRPGPFHVSLEREFQRADRHHLDLSVIIVDLDQFRKVSERHGMSAAEDILNQIGGMISDNLRGGDLVSRYAGENFAVALPLTRASDAMRVARRIREDISHHSFDAEGAGEELINLTASTGVASLLKHDPSTESELLEFASRAVRQAKLEGEDSGKLYETGPGR